MFSALILVFGIILTILTVKYDKNDGILRADLGDFTATVEKFRWATAGTSLVFSIWAMLIGLLGIFCIFKFCANRCFVVMYGFSLLFIWLVMLIVGGAISTVAIKGPTVAENVCKDDMKYKQMEYLETKINEVDK